MACILIVDSDTALRQALGDLLRRESYAVCEAPSGEAALQLARDHPPDVVILETDLPDLPGFAVCLRLRERADVPVVFTSARASEIERVAGLELGADDYVLKPYYPRELVARVRAILRRVDRQAAAPERIVADGLTIEPRQRRVLAEGLEVALKPREFELLAFLARHPGEVFTREELLAQLWKQEFGGDTRTVDIHVGMLRAKLADRKDAPRWIETVHRVGYRFRAPAAPLPAGHH